jgi:tetratricopeptide (TPR) repeat protein/tRNA A-37 threonylcarbamoyl transferase component Bud32
VLQQAANERDVPGYCALRKIGRGGMGEVYAARQSDTQRSVAIKFLAPHSNRNSRELKRRFDREARLMSGLAHPNIVTVVDHGTVAGQDYFVMEYVDGPSLRELLHHGRPMETTQACVILHGICQALSYLHDSGIVHRDLKPDNVLIDPSGNVKLTDFGISTPLSEVGIVTGTGEFLGTLDYIAPEQRARLPIDQRVDQYSLGVMAFEMLTGRLPIGGAKPPSQLNPQLSPQVDAVLSKSLQEDPDDRYATVSDFGQALDRALLGWSARSRWWSLAGLAACFVAVLATGGWSVCARARAARAPAPPALPPAAELAQPVNPASDNDAQLGYFLSLGEEHAASGRYPEAEMCFGEAIGLAPKSPQPLIARGRLYKMIGQYQEALDDLARALDLDPTRADARTGRGSIYVQIKDYDKAIVELDEAVRLDPSGAEAFAYRGWAYHGLKDDERATADLDQALSIDATCGVGYQFRGLLLKTRKDYAAARANYEAAVQAIPADPYFHATLAGFLATCPDKSLRDSAAALNHAQRACELSNWKDWRNLKVLATSYRAVGDMDAAVTWCERALELAPPSQRAAVEADLDAYRRARPVTAPRQEKPSADS